jgi:hypothetical protein
MKRFFIFAAMLLNMTVYAGTITEDPHKILPGEPEKIVLVPQDLYDIDRSIVLCEYICQYNYGVININCYGTGTRTVISVVDEYGNSYDQTMIDTNICNHATLDLPEEAGYYMIILNSELYHGESVIRIE